MKVQKKKEWILWLVILMLFITGCHPEKQQPVDEGKVVKGCYVEKIVELPNKENMIGLNRTCDGEILYATCNQEEGSYTIYAFQEDMTWMEICKVYLHNQLKEEMENEGAMNLSVGLEKDSIYMLVGLPDGRAEIVECFADGSASKIMLEDKEDFSKYRGIHSILKAENGDYIVQKDWDGELVSYEGKTGKLKNKFGENILSFKVYGNDITFNTGWETGNVFSAKVDSGKCYYPIGYEGVSNTNVIDRSKEGIYLFNSTGIQYIDAEGSVWQKVVPADRNKLVDATANIRDAFVLEDESFLIWFEEDDITLYTYDPEAEDVVSAEITVAMDVEHRALTKALNLYQEKHKDVRIHIQYYATGTGEQKEAMNVQILAGGGPDIILLDSIDIEKYIEKGVLVDIGDLAENYNRKQETYRNIINTYQVDGKVYAIPLRFMVPMICGKKEIVSKVSSLEDLVEYKKTHPNEVLFNKSLYDMARQLYLSSTPMLINEEGEITRQTIEKYFNDLSSICEKKEDFSERNISGDDNYENTDIQAQNKMKEAFDYIDGKSGVFLVCPRNVWDIGMLDAFLDASEEKGDISALRVNGQIIYNVKSVLGINANSKHQDIAREIIESALESEIQNEISMDGFPIGKEDMKEQEYILEYLKGSVFGEEVGRQVTSDGDIKEIYSKYLEYCDQASLCADMPYKWPASIAMEIVYMSMQTGDPLSKYIAEAEDRIKLQEAE